MKPWIFVVAFALVACGDPSDRSKERDKAAEEGKLQAAKIIADLDAKHALKTAAMDYEFAVSSEALGLRQRSELAQELGNARQPGKAELLSIQFRDKRGEVEDLRLKRTAAESRLKSLIKKARPGSELEDAEAILQEASDRIRLAEILTNGSVPPSDEQWARVEESRYAEISRRWKTGDVGPHQ